jgi:hypothetical protein
MQKVQHYSFKSLAYSENPGTPIFSIYNVQVAETYVAANTVN